MSIAPKVLGFAMAMASACLWGAWPAQAGVNLKNGNFYITYTDLISPTPGKGQVDGKIEIVRTYNSRATKVAGFGYGWGWDYATLVVPNHEGGVTIHENLSGKRTHLGATNHGRGLERSVELIREAETSRPFPRGSVNGKWHFYFTRDLELRTTQSESNLRDGVVLAYHPPVGWRFKSDENCNNPNCGTDHRYTVLRTPGGYQRVGGGDGRREVFSLDGHLIMTQQANGYFVRIFRDAEGRVQQLKDVNGYEVWFDYNDAGQVRRIRDSAGQSAHYRYEGRDLVWTQDANGNTYTHEYDSNHNMTQIGYEDGSTFEVTYDEDGYVSSIRKRDGKRTTYEYGSDPENPQFHYWTIVMRPDESGKSTHENRYEYTIGVTEGGRRFTQRIVQDVASEKRHIVSRYSPQGQISETVNGQETRYTYHPTHSGLASIITPDLETHYEYHPQRKLVVTVREKAPESGWERTVEFEYSADLNRLLSIVERTQEGDSGAGGDHGVARGAADREQDRVARFQFDDLGRTSKVELSGSLLQLHRDRFGNIDRIGLDDGAMLGVEDDDSVEPYGFTLETSVEGKESYQQALRDRYHQVRELVSLGRNGALVW